MEKQAKVQPWEKVGLSNSDVDEGDYLLDWRSGGGRVAVRASILAGELQGLAEQVQMQVEASFFSDGENGRLGLYQVWVNA